MKKPIKITLFVLATITIVAVVAAVVMLKAVSGDALFYMNSTLGSIYAVSYRWVCLVSGVLILFWILFVVKKRKSITAMLPKFSKKEKKTKVPAIAPITDTVPVTTMLCTKCGKQTSLTNKFCPFCGEPVAPSASEKETIS